MLYAVIIATIIFNSYLQAFPRLFFDLTDIVVLFYGGSLEVIKMAHESYYYEVKKAVMGHRTFLCFSFLQNDTQWYLASVEQNFQFDIHRD